MNANRYVFKCVIIGDSHVGKTSLLRRYLEVACSDNKRIPKEIPMDGQVKMTLDRHGATIELTLFDTLGMEHYKSLTQSYYRNTRGCLLCFDVYDEGTFHNLKSWLEAIKYRTDSSVTKLLVGIVTKPADDSHSHVTRQRVSVIDAENFAEENHLTYLEVDLADEHHVYLCFETLVDALLDDAGENGHEIHNSVSESVSRSHVGSPDGSNASDQSQSHILFERCKCS